MTTFLCVAPPRDFRQLAWMNSVLVEFNWLHLATNDKWFGNLQEITQKKKKDMYSLGHFITFI
jgi:hypothetical protein